jgi:hypothetical protein
MRHTRTVKTCGPDASRLASSRRRRCRPYRARHADTAGDGVNKTLITGESTKERLKPLRGECRVNPAASVVATLVCFFHLHARLRAQRAPGIPCALCFEAKDSCMTRTQSRREIAEVCSAVIASVSEAIHSYSLAALWIASLTLAMTVVLAV